MVAFSIPDNMGFNSKKFQLGHAQALTPSGTAGFIQTINRTAPFWYAEYTTPPLTDDVYGDVVAFLDGLEGSIGTFLAYDPRRIMPKAYKGQLPTSTPWGSPQITAYNYAASSITLGSLDVGAVISKGDYISMEIGGIYYLYRSLQNQVVGGGGTATLVVRPRPQIIGFTASPIECVKAVCEMKMIGDYEESDSVSAYPVISFKAGQFINRAGV